MSGLLPKGQGQGSGGQGKASGWAPLELLRLGHVRLDVPHPRRQRRLGRRRPQVSHHDPHPALVKGDGHGAADASGAAGDHGPAALEGGLHGALGTAARAERGAQTPALVLTASTVRDFEA